MARSRHSTVAVLAATLWLTGCGTEVLSHEPSHHSQLLSAAPAPHFELGMLRAVGDAWQRVRLRRTYASMVVIATPSYGANSVPVVTRVRNARDAQFEIRVQSFDGLPLTSQVQVQYLVVEEGQYSREADGLAMEAVKFTSTETAHRGSWVGEAREYLNVYASPVVLGQVMSAHDERPSVFWSRGSRRRRAPDGQVLRVGKHSGEDPAPERADELIGYVVFEAGSGSLGGVRFDVATGADAVVGITQAPYAYPSPATGPAAVAVLSQAGMDGGNGSWAVLAGEYATVGPALEVAVDEDVLGDAERRHVGEQVAYAVFNVCPEGADRQACGPDQVCDQGECVTCPDADSDGVCDAEDRCPTGDDSEDVDADGTPDACDECASHGDCDDGNPCTVGHCGGAACVQEAVALGSACDGGLCTRGGSCLPTDPDGCVAGASGRGILEGNVVVDGQDTQGDLAVLDGIYCVTGDLTIENTSLTDLSSLALLQGVGRSLFIGGIRGQNTALESLEGLSNLKKVGGNLWLRRSAVTSLAGLEGIRRVPWTLYLDGNAQLTDLSALAGYDDVGSLDVRNHPNLESLRGLEGLRSLNNLTVSGNAALADLEGLDELGSVSGGLNITYNSDLSDLSALSGVTGSPYSVYVLGNPQLRTLAGLGGIAALPGSLQIRDNEALTTLADLDALTRVGGTLTVSGNTALPSCEGFALAARLQMVCTDCSSAPDTDGDGVPDACDKCPAAHPDDGNGDGRCDDRAYVEAVSRALGGGLGNGQSWDGADISDDGRYVVFRSHASDLVAGDTNGVADLFLRDRRQGTTRRLSVGPNGEQANGAALGFTTISSDGRFVAYSSRASNLVEGDGPGEDCFIVDTTNRVHTKLMPSTRCRLSSDGTKVVVENRVHELWLYDLSTGASELVSIDDGGQSAWVQFGDLSRHGRFVTFSANRTVYRRDVWTGESQIVPVRPDGSAAAAYSATLSDDGRFVLFDSSEQAAWGSEPDGTAFDAFLRDMSTGETVHVSDDRSAKLAGTASRVLYTQAGRCMVTDRATSESFVANTNPDGQPAVGQCFTMGLSADGHWALISARDGDLVEGDTNGELDLFVAYLP